MLALGEGCVISSGGSNVKVVRVMPSICDEGNVIRCMGDVITWW